jgi:uncharacterized membrane protein YphA (DoxX/SURF4 family)
MDRVEGYAYRSEKTMRKSMPWRLKECVLALLRILLGLLLLWSGLQKIMFPYTIVANVYQYELFDRQAGVILAIAVPWLEVVLGVCLISGICLSGSLCLAVGLTSSFVVMQSSALHRHIRVRCGCFGVSAVDEVSWNTIAVAAAMAIAATASLCVLVFSGRRDEENVCCASG